MAKAIKCDKCKITSSDKDYFMHIRAYKLQNITSYEAKTMESFDLCKKCYIETFKNKESEEK